ncbi:MAG: radical SAM family heme chaperone HemW [Erysipelotrichaceae bacterium]|nr:radical SAM family heme chaperone HemW [Erysipelotrichaceae bacterium]
MMTRINHLYIHVPFCKTICSYCDFCHRVYNKELVNKWLLQFELEIKNKCHDQYSTIYIGGGTPTCLSNDELEQLLSLIDEYSKNVIEYTIEVNPETIDVDKIKTLVKHKINRISMGVQSSDDELLKLMNRHHNFELVKEKIELLRSYGLNNISVDLMYSLPNQTMDMLKQSLFDIVSLDVPHISIYSLTIEENSVFGKKGFKSLDSDIEADMYEYINTYLTSNNYHQYEVSNYSKIGYESKHNLGYWNYDDFLGLSLAGSSKLGNHRYTNTYSFEEYFNDYNCKSEDLILTLDDMKFENIMMSLRTIYGLNINEFNNKYNCDLILDYHRGISNSNIYIENGFLKCKNLEILNNVLLDFMN